MVGSKSTKFKQSSLQPLAKHWSITHAYDKTRLLLWTGSLFPTEERCRRGPLHRLLTTAKEAESLRQLEHTPDLLANNKRYTPEKRTTPLNKYMYIYILYIVICLHESDRRT